MSSSQYLVYRFVPIVEVEVASVSAISMIPLFIVLYNTAVLHQLQIALVIFEYNKQVYLPDKIDGEEMYLVVHEFAYAMSTMLALFLAIERFVACLNARTYEKSSRSCIGIFVVLLISFPSPLYGHTSTTFLSFSLFFYSKRLYTKETNYSVSLHERYQMNEIVQYSRAFVPAISVSSFIKILGLIPVFIWQEGWGQYGFMRALFFTAHSINWAVMKNMLLMGHSALRRAFLKTFSIFCCLCFRRRRVVIFTMESAVSRATDNHFDMLNSI